MEHYLKKNVISIENLHKALKEEIAYQHNSSYIVPAHLICGQMITHPFPSPLKPPYKSNETPSLTPTVVWPRSQEPPL